MLTGNNGILTQAQNAKKETEEAEDIEKIKIAMSEAQISEDGYQKLEVDNFQEALNKQFDGENLQLIDNGDGSFIINLDNMSKTFYADDNGKIISNENILEINSLDGLKKFRDDVNNGNTYENWYVYLSNDITLDEDWNPIGKYDASSSNPDDSINRAFSGIFDGMFHKIYNLNINSTEKAKGLFALIKGGTVKNLGIENGKISSNSSVGGIVGYTYDNSKIINCYNKANINASDRYAGGIVGYAKQGVNIENCYNAGTITANYSVGGISGEINNSEILNCYNIGNINGEDTNARSTGGISGTTANNTTITNSYNRGIITSPFVAGAIIGKVVSGNNIVKNCYFFENTVNGGNGSDIEGVEVKNEEELKKIYMILRNDFKEDKNNINNGYPILSWQ